MLKYPIIVDAPWRGEAIYADSVSHFLHWDMTYLLVLEKPTVERPTSWAHRNKAWRQLLGLFLLGEVKIVWKSIDPTFLRYSSLYQISQVGWLAKDSNSAPIGVVSPTVLVRPLPDFQSTDLEHWPSLLDDDPVRKQKLRHYVALAIRQLRTISAGNQKSVAARLVNILIAEFSDLGDLQPLDPGFPAHDEPVRILEQVTWVSDDIHWKMFDLQVAGIGKIWFVPKCSNAACGKYLTYEARQEPIQVVGDHFDLKCPGCERITAIPLSQMLIWNRSDDQVIIWKDRVSPDLRSTQQRFPPDHPRIEANVVTFEWDAGQLGGEPRQRFVRLAFKGQPEEKAFDDIRFRNLLVPGGLNEGLSSGRRFCGLPIRPEWRDALDESSEAEPHVVNKIAEVKYRFKIKGWPFAFDYTHTRPQEKPNLAIGLYPDYMGPDWKHYRLFSFGEDRERFRLSASNIPEPSSRRIPWVLDTLDGWPEWAALVNDRDPQEGVLFDLSKAAANVQRAAGSGLPQIAIAIDFGTTNSLVYFQPHGIFDPLEPQTNAVETGAESFLSVAHIASGDPAKALQAEQSWFLPSRQIASTGPDPYLIPSAFWEGAEIPVVRWCKNPPVDGLTPVHNFKLDEEGQPNAQRRQQYLGELLFLTIPYALRKLNLRLEKPRLSLGWAFPLALSGTEFSALATLWGTLSSRVRLQMGLADVNHFAIDESKANVQAFGRHNPGDSFLVADMGGGTIDLALFTFTTPDIVEYHQIGSIKFAGERYLGCLSKEKYWDYRDSIQGGTGLLRSNKVAADLFDRFVVLAFDFLRTMYASYKIKNVHTVRLVLAGNGWGLLDAVKANVNFSESYRFLCDSLGYQDLTLYSAGKAPILRKHLMVQGILENAKRQAINRQQELSRSRLPAGRDIEFRPAGSRIDVPWYQLVGDGSDSLNVVSSELSRSIDVKLASGPANTKSWEERWKSCFAAPSHDPELAQLRSWLAANIEGSPARLRKGPLQLLLENWWPQVLTEMQNL